MTNRFEGKPDQLERGNSSTSKIFFHALCSALILIIIAIAAAIMLGAPSNADVRDEAMTVLSEETKGSETGEIIIDQSSEAMTTVEKTGRNRYTVTGWVTTKDSWGGEWSYDYTVRLIYERGDVVEYEWRLEAFN